MMITAVDAQTDAPAITAIYRHYVLNSPATFEEIPPTISQMRERILDCLNHGYPFLVAKIDGRCVGYTSVKLFYGRSAFHPTVENSIFLDPKYRGRGVGKQLLTRLIDECTELGLLNIVALVGGGEQNQASTRLHQSCGFEIVGNLRNVGRKLGQPQDMSIMQITLPMNERPSDTLKPGGLSYE